MYDPVCYVVLRHIVRVLPDEREMGAGDLVVPPGYDFVLD